MISKLVTALQRIDAELTAEDIADVLWLALEMKKKSVESFGAAATTSSDSTATSAEGTNELLPERRVNAPSEQPALELPGQPSGPQPVSSGLYPGSSPRSNSKGKQMGVLPFRSPAATALPGSRDIARTLRPFRRRIPLPGRFVLNEEATAKRIAEEGLWVPVLDHASTNWLEVVLVVDKGASMTIWRQTISELHRLLARHGAFRDVRLWELDTNDPGMVRLYAGTGAGIHNRQVRSDRELIDTSGRRLILVVTDCVSPAWRSGSVAKTLEKWGYYNSVTIVQVLPQRLWSRTALGMIAPVRLHASTPGIPNKQLLVRATHYGRDGDKEPQQRVAIPIITLEPKPLTAWTRVIARAEDVWIPGFELAIPSQAVKKPEQNGYALYEQAVSITLPSAERVQRFRADASSPARRLAGLLATVPITLPIIRLIQQAMFHEPRQVHVAEVFLSGLLEVTSANSDTLDPDAVVYDFVDSERVRELLLNSVSPEDTSRVLPEISAFITSRFAHPLDFGALLADPLSKEGIVIDEENRPFALMGAKALRRFGGEYRELADWLEEESRKREEQDGRTGLGAGVYVLEGVDGQEQLAAEDKVPDDSAEMMAQEMIHTGEAIEDILETIEYDEVEKIVEDDKIVDEHVREVGRGEMVEGEVEGYQGDTQPLPVLRKSRQRDGSTDEEEPAKKEEIVEGVSRKTKDFFISYHSVDRQWAEWIAWQFEEAHYAVELRAWDFQPGADFAQELDTILKRARRIIFVLSPDYLNTFAAMPGWIPAFLEEPRGDEEQGIMIALQVRECIREFESLLGEITYLDLVGLNELQAREQLLSFVQRERVERVKRWGEVERLVLLKPAFPKILSRTPPISSSRDRAEAIEVFCSYADRDKKLWQELEKQLVFLRRQGLITDWHTRNINAGMEYEISSHVNTARIILLLVSPDFMASDYCYSTEMKRALERHERREAHVIPIILRPVDWKYAPFSELQMLPTDAKPVTKWRNRTEAFLDVANGIRKAIEGITLRQTTPSGSLLRIFNVPFPSNPFFTGREELLDEIHSKLTRERTTAITQRQAISGLGGIGKTQLAVKYAHRYAQDYKQVFWVIADSRETIIQEYVKIAEKLELPERNEQDQQLIVAAVMRWLETHSDWLLVLDNADDLKIVQEYIPNTMNGHLLLTTRAQELATIAESIEIDKMRLEEGKLFLLRRAKVIAADQSITAANKNDQLYAEKIVQKLDGLPLALDQAGAYIEETGASLGDYVRLYQDLGVRLLEERRGISNGHPESVVKTFLLAFNKVEQNSATAANLLRLCAFLAPDDIPESLFTEHLPVLIVARNTPAPPPQNHKIAGIPIPKFWSSPGKPPSLSLAESRSMLDEASEALRKLSLIRRDHQKEMLSVHHLVQAVLKESMPENMQRQWAENAIRIVNDAFPDATDVNTWPECQRLLPHTLVCAELIKQWNMKFPEAARLLDQAGAYLRERVQYAKAESLLIQALMIREKEFGPEHLDTANSYNNLAMLYAEQGKYEQAEPLYQRALGIKEKVLGSEHPEVALSLNNLASLYNREGKYTQAESLLERTLAIREKVLGSGHPSTAVSLNNLGRVYTNQGKSKQAEPLYQRALAILEQALGPEHPYIASCLNDLAVLYSNQGKYEQAEPLYQRSLAIYEKTLGGHPNTALVLEGYAILLRNTERVDEAELLMRRAKEVRARYAQQNPSE